LKQTPLLLTLAVLILIASGYFLYEKVFHKDALRPWDLVPSETILVYEKDVCQSCIDEMEETALWKIVQRAAYYSKPADSLQRRLAAVLNNRPGLLVSVHITKKDDFDFIYFLPHAENLLESVTHLSQLKGYRYSERELNEVRIHELTFKQYTFSWVIIRDVWVGSFTPFLIEDVIRTYKGKPNFNKANPDVKKLPRISGDAGNIYIQLRSFADWLAVFTPARDKSFDLGKSSVLDLKSIGNNFILNGFSLDSTAWSDYLLSIVRNQSPVSFGLKNFVPNRAIMFTSFGIDDGPAFAADLRRFVSSHRPQLRASLEKLSQSLKFNWDDLYGTIDNEIGVCHLEGIESQTLSKIVMIETKSPDQWIGRLNEVSEKLSEDTVFHERFSHYEIREMPEPRFPEKLFWPLVQGFDHTFYTSSGNTLIMGDNLEELKNFLEDIEHDDVWGKSVSKNQFLESTLLESNISLFINTARIWNVIAPELYPRWRQFVRENQPLLQSLQMSAFQFSHLNNTFYTNVTVNQSKEKTDVTFASASRQTSVQFEQPIQRLYAVRSHVSRENEILIQDSLNDISLLSMDGKILWKLPIGDQITSDIQQIDFFNNGKLQYIFSTHDAIHVIDRLGKYVHPYPLYLKGKDIEFLSVVDYDRSKKYRFLVGERTGKIWMYDKSGTNLEGWTPRDAGAPLLSAPAHHRIKGRDFILAIRRDGVVNLYNRKGEVTRNFPLDLQGTPMGDYFLEMGPDISSSYFVVVTRDGFRLKFNPEGKIQSRETLLRASVRSQFRLISERSDKSYLIAQSDAHQFTVTDAAGKKLLTNTSFTTGNPDVKYYHFGGGKSFISLTDKIQELSYVFDAGGNLITEPPLESTAIELRMANSDQCYVFFIHDKTLAIQPLKP
jgi:hypothetical protein